MKLTGAADFKTLISEQHAVYDNKYFDHSLSDWTTSFSKADKGESHI
jgi:hypothetical protein